MEERTLMQDICEVVQLANGSHLSDDFWGNAAHLLERLGRRLDLPNRTPIASRKWYSKRCRPERNSLRPRSAALRSTNFSCDWGKLISYTSQQEMSQTELAEELQQLIDRNQQLEFCCRFREFAQSLHIWDTLSLHNAAIFM